MSANRLFFSLPEPQIEADFKALENERTDGMSFRTSEPGMKATFLPAPQSQQIPSPLIRLPWNATTEEEQNAANSFSNCFLFSLRTTTERSGAEKKEKPRTTAVHPESSER